MSGETRTYGNPIYIYIYMGPYFIKRTKTKPVVHAILSLMNGKVTVELLHDNEDIHIRRGRHGPNGRRWEWDKIMCPCDVINGWPLMMMSYQENFMQIHVTSSTGDPSWWCHTRKTSCKNMWRHQQIFILKNRLDKLIIIHTASACDELCCVENDIKQIKNTKKMGTNSRFHINIEIPYFIKSKTAIRN